MSKSVGYLISAGAPFFSEKFLAYACSNFSQGIRLAMITQRFSVDNFPSNGSSYVSGSLGGTSDRRYINTSHSGARLFGYFTPFGCTFLGLLSVRIFFPSAFQSSSASPTYYLSLHPHPKFKNETARLEKTPEKFRGEKQEI
jgi:hypothetical protein